jgi:hypothetical protein
MTHFSRLESWLEMELVHLFENCGGSMASQSELSQAAMVQTGKSKKVKVGE